MKPKSFLEKNAVPPKVTDINAWADFVEIRCLMHPDGFYTLDALIDEALDAQEAGEELELDSPSTADAGLLPNDEYEDTPSNLEETRKRERLESKLRQAFTRIEARVLHFGGSYPFHLIEGRILQKHSPLNASHRLYISLLLSANLRLATPSVISRVGNMFERLCGPFFQMLIPPNSECHHFGAGADNEGRFSGGLKQKIETLCNLLETQKTVESEQALPTSGDGGLDWIAFYKFTDTPWRIPVFFAQCACGIDWEEKQDEASRLRWDSYMQLTFPIMTTMFTPRIPRADDNKIEKYTAIHRELVFVDRPRILELAQIPDEDENSLSALYTPILQEFFDLEPSSNNTP